MRNKDTTNQIPSRRDFFVKIALASVATTLPSLAFQSCEDVTKYQGSGVAPFKVWEEMLHAIKTSPDFLPQRVENLIASKNLEAMYNFVKNEITLIPTANNAISKYDLGTGYKWGLEGVLRCGMATAREKADLLTQMFTKAGISAKVVYERTAIEEEDVPSFFYRPLDRVFNPDISERQFKRWEQEMAGSSTTVTDEKELLTDYLKDADNLGDKIIKALPNIAEFGTKYNFKWDNRATPTVAFKQNNITQYAHLFDPKTLFGRKHNSSEGQIIEAKPVKKNTDTVSLKITYRNTIDPLTEIDLIKGEWNATELIGKQVQLSFLHGLSLEEQIVTPVGNLRVFTPALALQAIDKELEYVQDRSFLADPITLNGKRIPVSNEKIYGANGNEILVKSHPQLQNEVEKLTVVPTVSSYPTVKLSIDARDASNTLIEGLSARDFKILDNGEPVRAILENNQRTPKILVLSDNSGSMPDAYRNEGMKTFNDTLHQKIITQYPAAVLRFWKTPSSLFTWLLKASQTDYDLILFATDGDNDDNFEEKNLPTYKAGPPSIILNVYDSKANHRMDAFTKMAEITNGIVLNAENQEKVLEEITKYIEGMELMPYAFTYASADNTKPHKVEVTLDNERVKALGNYTFPSTELDKKNGIAGIYLELTVGKKTPIKRVLAGWHADKTNGATPTSKHVDAVKELFLGGVMLAVEGEGPTLAVALADLLKSKLSNRTWGEAYLKNDIKKAAEELSKGSVHIPAILIPMLAPLQNQVTKTGITYPTGYRMCLLKTTVGLGQPSTFTFDYLQTSAYETMAKNKVERFSTTLKRTAQFAVREGAMFQQSTYTSLTNSDHIDSKSANKASWIKQTIAANHIDYPYWREHVLRGTAGYTQIFDVTANSKSFWRLQNRSGELYGILPDGSGGGGDKMKKQLDNLNLVIESYMLVLSLLRAGGPSLSVIASLKKAEVKLWAITCETIIVMDTEGMDDALKKVMQQLACNLYKDMFMTFSKNANAYKSLLYVIKLMTGKSLC